MLINLRNKITRIGSSEYLRNAAIVTSGTIFAQTITIFTGPLLTRIYTPADYDILGIYLMVTSIVSSMVTLQYHNVIIIAKNDGEAKTAVFVSLFVSATVALLSFIIVLLTRQLTSNFFGYPVAGNWMMFAPISIFMSGWNTTFSAWVNRNKEFKLLSLNKVLAAILVPVISISVGTLVLGPSGLLAGLLVSQLIPSIQLSRVFFKNASLDIKFDWKEVKEIIKMYASFPKYTLPSEFVNVLINQLPVVILSSFYRIPGE
jgi:O-antigen/teichoic acid export membrane protein